MPLLATIRPEDVDKDAGQPDYTAYTMRPASRAIIFDGDKVALVHILKHSYYMLPGGGTDEGENTWEGLQRESQEEIGCEVKLGQQVGVIETYIGRWQNRQVDTCYIVYKTGNALKEQTDFEKEEGHAVVWAANLDEAIKLMEGARPANPDGKLVRARDLIFLNQAYTLIRQR